MFKKDNKQAIQQWVSNITDVNVDWNIDLKASVIIDDMKISIEITKPVPNKK